MHEPNALQQRGPLAKLDLVRGAQIEVICLSLTDVRGHGDACSGAFRRVRSSE
jgi:hypothetical protein